MAKAVDQNALRAPIDPSELYDRMVSALGYTLVRRSPEEIVSQKMPSFALKDFRERYLLREVLRKYPGFDLGVDRRQAAIDSFLEQEQTNRCTNIRLTERVVPEKGVLQVFELARRKVPSVLKDFRWDWFIAAARHGPGSTTRLGRRDASLPNKLSGRPYATRSSANLAYTYLQHCPSWIYNCSDVVDQSQVIAICNYDRAETVPKTALTDRFITIPSDLTVFMQLGVGGMLRRRLSEWGVDLQDQSINRQRALSASQGLALATVDLSNASNSIVRELVWRLIGDHSRERVGDGFLLWYRVLEALRSEGGMVDGTYVDYEMWSAMGNGYTFELETLVFWLLTTCTCQYLGIPEDVTVYGDDIVCPEAAVPLLQAVFSHFGFTMNSSKSYWNTVGPRFRESCGGHYLNGMDVTPFYVKDELTTVPAVILLMNNIKRWSKTPFGLDGRLKPVYDWLKTSLPPRARQSAVPFGEDDDGLIKDFDEARPAVKISRTIRKRVEMGWDWCLDEEGANPSLRWKAKTVRCNWTGQKIGYKARTVRTVRRAKSAEGQLGVTAWLYLRETHAFKPHPVIPEWRTRNATNVRIAGDGRHLEAKEPLQVPTQKESVKYSQRVVPSWTDAGPWVTPGPCTLVLDEVIAMVTSAVLEHRSTTSRDVVG